MAPWACCPQCRRPSRIPSIQRNKARSWPLELGPIPRLGACNKQEPPGTRIQLNKVLAGARGTWISTRPRKRLQQENTHHPSPSNWPKKRQRNDLQIIGEEILGLWKREEARIPIKRSHLLQIGMSRCLEFLGGGSIGTGGEMEICLWMEKWNWGTDGMRVTLACCWLALSGRGRLKTMGGHPYTTYRPSILARPLSFTSDPIN